MKKKLSPVILGMLSMITVLIMVSCNKKDDNKPNSLDISCIEGVWKEKFPEGGFTKSLTFFGDNNGVHRILPDSTRNFTWGVNDNIISLEYSDIAFDRWNFILDCDENLLTLRGIGYQKSDDNVIQPSPNMKVWVNGADPIDVTAVVDCRMMGNKNQFLITGSGNGIGAINLVFRGVAPASGEHELFYDLNTHNFISVEFTIGSDVDVIRGHTYSNDCCGGGTITITEKNAGRIAGTFDVINGDASYHLTGEFNISFDNPDCN